VIVALLFVVTLAAAAGLIYLIWQRVAPQTIVEGQPFRPAASGWVRGGTYHIPSVDIPADVTVTTAGDLELIVGGETHLAGRLAGICAAIAVRGEGAVVVTGSIDNVCDDADAAGAKHLLLQSQSDVVTLGSAATTARLHTSGALEVISGPAPADWHFDVLPTVRSAEPMPPVCSIEANTVAGVVLPDLFVSGARTVFAGYGADPDGGPVTYAWDFGDDNTSTAPQPEHAYAAPGIYDVVLDVADDEGQTCRATARVIVDDSTVEAGVPGVWAAPAGLVAATSAEVTFRARALAPDGAPVVYRWDFGDGGTSNQAQPLHRYTTAGRYDVTLTAAVLDDPVLTSTAVASIHVYDPPVPETRAGSPRPVSENRVDAAGVAVRFRYDGDVVFLPGSRLNALPPTRSVGDSTGAEAGGLTGSSGGDVGVYATGNISIPDGDGDYGASTLLAAAGADGTDSDDRGGDGGNGGTIMLVAEGDIVVGSRTVIAAGDGGDGGDGGTPPKGDAVVGGSGGRGGRVILKAGGWINIEDGASLAAGSGGAGGDTAVASAESGLLVYARGGSGGVAGNVAIDAVQQMRFVPAQGAAGSGTAAMPHTGVVVRDGLGGAGGAASATGATGASGCPSGGDGAAAVALGGSGGNGAPGWLPNRMICQTSVTLRGGNGGAGGAATATGGDGGQAGNGTVPCTSAARGGDGGGAVAVGGDGGPSGAFNLPAAPCADRVDHGDTNTLAGGPGGVALAVGGTGGDAAAVGPACGESAKAEGGPGGAALAHGGSGARGGAAGAYPGDGGAADARGGDCRPLCGRPGGNAWATGGTGGIGNARGGAAAVDTYAGAAVAGPDVGREYGMGRGGRATAHGGTGGDCTAGECPAGRGGRGGAASATGGIGGILTDTAGQQIARAGDALAAGGDGGRGAACCDPPSPGGDGAAGGNADASVQAGGTAIARGGRGGAGGDGLGPGTGGAGGAPEGRSGTDGSVCLVTPTHTPAPTPTPTSTPTPAPTSTSIPSTATATPGPTATATPAPTGTRPPLPTATAIPEATATADVAKPPPASTLSPTPVTSPEAAAITDSGPVGVFYLAYYAAGRTAVDDLRVRQALTQTIDRAALLSLTDAPGARLANGLVPTWQYPDPAARAALGSLGLPYDPQAAAALADEVRRAPEQGGWPDEITLAALQSERAVAEAIAAAWEGLGVRVQRRYFELQPGESLDTPRYRDWLRQQRPQAYLRALRADRLFDVFLIELLEDTPLRWSPDEARAHLQAIEAAGRGSRDGQAVADAVFEAEQTLVNDAVLYAPLFYYDLQPG
jgi:PKD repeat protein